MRRAFYTRSQGNYYIDCRKCPKDYDANIEAYQTSITKKYFLIDKKEEKITWLKEGE